MNTAANWSIGFAREQPPAFAAVGICNETIPSSNGTLAELFRLLIKEASGANNPVTKWIDKQSLQTVRMI